MWMNTRNKMKRKHKNEKEKYNGKIILNLKRINKIYSQRKI